MVSHNDPIVSQLAQQDKAPWYTKPNLRLLYLFMLPACLGTGMTSGLSMSMMDGLQAVPSWLEYFHHPRSASLGLMTSTYFLGSFVAILFVPSVADSAGRRYPIILGDIMVIIGGILQGSAQNFLMFVIARFILGVGKVFCIVATASLVGELSHPKERAVMGAILSVMYDLGTIAASAVTLRTFAMASNWGWRIPSFIQIVPSLLQVSFICFIPESPRWLVSRGRGTEAYVILVKYHGEGDESSDFVKAEYDQIEQTLNAESKAAQGGRNAAGMRKRVIIAALLGLFISWCGAGLISRYLVVILDNIGIHDNRTKNIIILARSSWNFLNGTVIALIVPRYPRRRIFLACTISIFVVFTAWTVANAEYSLTHSKAAALVVLVLTFVYSPAFNLAFSALVYTYLVELFPFHSRASGIAIHMWCGYGATFFSQFVNPIGIDAAGWRWYIVYCVWNALQVASVYFMFPETSGRTLEELSSLFDGDHAAANPDSEPLLHEDREARLMGDDSRESGHHA